ncbi:MAG: minichromosome maintenance protein MCM, partial [Candidatus Methanomethylophilaceae archaeon]|nr:minichromosome maintenance protein MCM [Candidatus Methanomethylophilaceae archaeon]
PTPREGVSPLVSPTVPQALTTSKRASSNGTGFTIMNSTDNIKPIYEAEFIRKYVSYAKRNCFPVMSPTARRMIENDFLSIRNDNTGPDAPVSITPRQLEAYIRISEASAKTRLSDVVEEQDASRAIYLINDYLKKIATTSDGKLDFDQFGNEYSQKERKSIKFYNESIINTIMENSDLGITENEICDKNPDIPKNVVKSAIENLMKANQIYENNGRYRWVG